MEIVRWVYTNTHAKRTVDVPGAKERVAPDYVFHPRRGFLGRTDYRLDEMVDLWADLDATFTDHSLVPAAYEAIGSAHVLVTLQQTALLPGSDQRLTDTIYMLWHLSEGRVRETWTFTDETQARAAAGLTA